ncbi:MAG: AI-2E family transporter [Ferruginibacter sp.]
MTNNSFNNHLRQVILLICIVALAIILISKLFFFLPGFLGAVTIYVLLKDTYYKLIEKKHWKPWIANLVLLLGTLIIIALPFFLSIELVSQKMAGMASNPAEWIEKAQVMGRKLEDYTGFKIITPANTTWLKQKASTLLPLLLNSTASLVSNLAVLFFLLYYLFKDGNGLERFLERILPFKKHNVEMLGEETKNMVKANAIGIPVLAVVQGLVAMLGYWIFGVEEFAMWGFVTGVFSMLPIVGTGVVWLPMCFYLFSQGDNSNALGLLIYSVVILTNVDYFARLTLLKKFMDVHPLITVFGVILGLSMFGFWGVVFGPLFLSYIITFFKIYISEFGDIKSRRVTEEAVAVAKTD